MPLVKKKKNPAEAARLAKKKTQSRANFKMGPTAKSPYLFCTLAFPSARDIPILANTSKKNLIYACVIKFSVLSKDARTNVTVRFDLIIFHL